MNAQQLTLKQTATEHGYKRIYNMLMDALFSKKTPTICANGCMADQWGRCKHGNPSVLSVATIGDFEK